MGFWQEKGKQFVCAAALLPLVCAGMSHADEYHYNSTIIGERPAGMAGAYTAVSDDASGLFHNPSGTVYSFGSNLSVSANAFSTSSKKYDNAGLNFAYDRRSETLQPNFFGVVQHTPYGTIGFSYAVQDSLLEEQNQTFANPTAAVSQWTLNYLKEYNVYNIGPSIAWDASKDLKIGITLYYHYKKYKIVNNSFQNYVNGTINWTNSLLREEDTGFRPIFGALYSPENGKYAAGLTVTQTFLTDSGIYFQSTQKTPSATSQYTTNPYFSIQRFNGETSYPYTAKFGLALFPSNAMLIAGDVSYTSAATDIWGDRQPVINAALGLEYYLSSSYAIRAGIFTDRSNTKAVSTASDPEHIDLYGLSFSASYFVKGSAVTMGFTDSFGSGQHWINSAATSSGTMSMNNLMVFLGSSYSY